MYVWDKEGLLMQSVKYMRRHVEKKFTFWIVDYNLIKRSNDNGNCILW